MPENKPIQTIIVGAGLSGLYAAWQLQKKNKKFIVLEARDRCGGRILSPQLDNSTDGCIDLGPAWVWPDFQPRLQQLISSHNLKLFKQFTHGDMLYEYETKHIKRYGDQSAHDMSFRFTGGAEKLTNALMSDIPESNIRSDTQVLSIRRPDDNAQIVVESKTGDEKNKYSADNVILALPPRLIQNTINISPALPEEVIQQWRITPTWMAGHCKMIFIYERPFWREQGLSGEVFSHQGPLSEIYDGSPESESFYALTAFVSLNANQRNQIDNKQLIDLSLSQLNRLFGEESNDVKDIKIKDWSHEKHTTTLGDLNGAAHHPQYPENISRHFWNKSLILAGTETAREYGGYIEGALESADDALKIIESKSIT